MTDKIKGVLIAAAAVAALAIGGVTIANAAGEESAPQVPPAELSAEPREGAEPGESPAEEAAEQATGNRAEQAAQAALEAVGGGRVLEVEYADEGMIGFEVEVQRPDGSYVEVNLDEQLNVVATGADD